MLTSCCTNKPCAVVCKIMCALCALATLASVAGLYEAHFGAAGSFGATTSSLSLIAFAINVMVFWKLGQAHCPDCKKAQA